MKKLDFNKLVLLIQAYVQNHPCSADCDTAGCQRKTILGLADQLQKKLVKGELPEGL